MRNLSVLLNTAAKAENVIFGWAVELDFADGFVRLNTTASDQVVGGNTYTGVGDLGTVSPIDEDASLRVTGINLTLSGASSALVTEALSSNYAGRSCRLFLILFDEAHGIIGTPYAVGTWRMDTMSLSMSDGKSAISLRANSILADWDRPRVRYYTDQDQQSRYAGDKFFEFLAPNVDRQINWGTA